MVYKLCAFVPLRANMKKGKDYIPLFKSWNQWYLFVIGFLVVLIVLFYWLTKYFA